jgi:DmsE family decaheme c-type cytochrome
MSRTLFSYLMAAVVLLFAVMILSPTLPAAHAQQTVGDDSCLECHEDQALATTNIHHRIMNFELVGIQKGCESCHGPGDAHMEEGDPEKIFSFSRATAEESSQACLKCHASLQAMDFNLGDHATNEVDCASCHSTHSVSGLVKPDPELCMDCHKDIMAKSNFPSRHPIREGKMKCSSCHAHHGSLVNNLKTHERMNDLCINCHGDKQGPFIFEHAPVVEDCSICHDPHGTVANSLLKQGEPFLCLQCHESHFHAGREGLTQPREIEGGLPGHTHSDNPFGTAGWRKAYLTKCTQCHFRIHGTDNPSQTIPGMGKGIIR